MLAAMWSGFAFRVSRSDSALAEFALFNVLLRFAGLPLAFPNIGPGMDFST